MRYLDKIDIAKALQLAARRGETPYLIIQVLSKTGVRVSELVNIKPQDILMNESQIIVKGKGGKIRNIDVPQELLFLLKLYIDHKKIPKNKRIFPVTIQAIWQVTKKVADVNPHVFRHSYAIELLRKTKNIRYVQVQLGHSTLATTQIYLRFMDYGQEKEKLGELYS